MSQKNQQPKYYPYMGREELIGYCDIHSETERALFPKEMIAQMVEYAGSPEDYSKPEEWIEGQNFYSMHEGMKNLVKLAREKLAKENLQ